MADLVVTPASRPLHGSVPVVPDKSVTHRALLCAALATGESRLTLRYEGADNRSTLQVLAALGVAHRRPTPDELIVEGVGLEGLTAPTGRLDCGNSGTTMRILAGLLAAQRFETVLDGDASLAQRPMERVAKPLRLRGARIEGRLDPTRPGESTPPLTIGPLPAPYRLSSLDYVLPVPSAQVKSALLFSGLYADGPTYVAEPIVSRDHTERMLSALEVPVQRVGSVLELDPSGWDGALPAFDLAPVGDLSAASFLVAAALTVPESRVTVRAVGTNPTRAGFLELVRDMGGRLESASEEDVMGEPAAHLTASAGPPLRGGALGGERLVRAIDEVPAACVVMAGARGESRIADAGELRVKESDRIEAMARVLRAFGVPVETQRDGLCLEGVCDRPLRAGDIDSGGDHRIAMAAAVLALRADGPTRIRGAECIAVSFPRFVGTLRALGADVSVTE